MAINLLVLGLDDVLFETETAHLISCNHAFETCRMDHQWSVGQYRNIALAHGAANVMRSVAGKSRATDSGSDAAMLVNEKNRLFHDLACQGRVMPQAGCVSLINDALEGGCKLAIVTDLPAQTAAVLLEQIFNDRLADMFAVIASGVHFDSLSNNSAYHLVLRTMGVDPWRSVAIESSAAGLVAAQRAGLWTLATTPHADDPGNVIGADAWYPRLRAPAHSTGKANIAGHRHGRFISFDVLDALKSASRMDPSFARPLAEAWP